FDDGVARSVVVSDPGGQGSIIEDIFHAKLGRPAELPIGDGDRAVVLDERVKVRRDRAEKRPRRIEDRAQAGKSDDRRAPPAKRAAGGESVQARVAIKLITADQV